MPRLSLASLGPDVACTFMHWTYRRHVEHPPLHDHDFHEVFWVTAGEGIEAVDGGPRALRPGMLVLVRPEDVHGFSASRRGAPLEFANFAFPSRLWKAMLRRHPALGGTLWECPARADRVVELAPAELDRVAQLSGELLASARDALAAEAFLGALVSFLARLDATRRRDRMPGWLRDLVARLADDRALASGPARLAAIAGCSPGHLCREVRRHLGTTPTGLLNAARMDHAARQLASTTRPILEIVADCGLGNVGHFYRLFRERFGTTPSRYRRNALPPAEARRRA